MAEIEHRGERRQRAREMERQAQTELYESAASAFGSATWNPARSWTVTNVSNSTDPWWTVETVERTDDVT